MATMGTARVTVARLARLGNGAKEGPARGRRVRPGCLMTQDPGPARGRRAFLNFIHSGIFVWGGSRTNRQQRRGDTLCALEYPSLSPPYVALQAFRLQASAT